LREDACSRTGFCAQPVSHREFASAAMQPAAVGFGEPPNLTPAGQARNAGTNLWAATQSGHLHRCRICGTNGCSCIFTAPPPVPLPGFAANRLCILSNLLGVPLSCSDSNPPCKRSRHASKCPLLPLGAVCVV
jgi:hypothetical protein